VVTIGEIFSLAEQWNWGSPKKDQLTALLKNVVHVPVHPMVVRRFAELDSFLIRSGRRIQQNDVWIAATASVLGGVLVTTDKDFNALAEAALIELCFVEPTSLPKG
jgi:predicted nucleic acid-binding protein